MRARLSVTVVDATRHDLDLQAPSSFDAAHMHVRHANTHLTDGYGGLMTEGQVRAAVGAAIEGLRQERPQLDFQRVHERSTAHRLAVQMEPLFVPWNVDCEYDRAGLVKKYLQGIAQCDEQRETDGIVPDIIVHLRRGEGRDHNLLVVEMKKDDPEDACDRMKLELLTAPDGHYAYQFGLYINIDGGNFVCTWYRDGRRQ